MSPDLGRLCRKMGECVCVVLITLVLSTKQLPHFSPAEHTHSDLTCMSNPAFSGLAVSSYLIVSRSFDLCFCVCKWVCVCVCVHVTVCVCIGEKERGESHRPYCWCFEWYPSARRSVSGVTQRYSEHISHPKSAPQAQNTHALTYTTHMKTQVHR